LQIGLFQFYNPPSDELQEYLSRQTESAQIFSSGGLIESEGIIKTLSETVRLNQLLEIKYESRSGEIISAFLPDQPEKFLSFKYIVDKPYENPELSRHLSPRAPPAYLS
jgi:hypothetical protein